ncbi:TetR family transcriptional regulator C-terminal domain-containing protein [Pseudocolwellia agarivorans]|uniref:TetR family transcriptional regulator C-terminal domain-containing protein n=1 Tax=Pseudocolwellia agarivorans TaxID=1911682 RepID=UPI003F88359B
MTEEIKQNKKEATREKNQQLILAAAEKIFAQLGYDGASMSMIAKEAGVAKANVHYYFTSKEGLYETVLENIVSSWNLGLEEVTVEDDPAVILYKYIQYKVILSIEKPMQSRLFAIEMIRGAPFLQDYIRKNSRPWFREKYELLQAWMDAGKMDQVDPNHLLFTIWSTTQYYADFETEALLLLNKYEYEESDVKAITQSIAQIILKGVGLSIPK